MLKLKHCDCRLNQWIENPNEPGETFTEELDNALLEKFFPNSEDKFSIGHIDQYSKVEDLKNHPNGDILLLASGSRLLYGPPEYLKTIEEICPDPKDRGAYGSLFIGNCPEEIAGKFNILVVDDEGIPALDDDGKPTGEWEVEPGGNGGILPAEEAFKLVGDCHGKIAPELAAQLAEGQTDRVIQHRMKFGENRLGKGTVAPWDLEGVTYADPNNAPRIDLVLPASSFKGGDKTNAPIQPGLYEATDLWMGRKDLSPENSKVAISQILPSFPQGMRDLIEESQEQALKLQELQKDPRSLAEEYVKNYEQRQANLQNTLDEKAELTDDEEEAPQLQDSLIYRVIKADLESGHPQLLETQRVQNELERYLRTKWRDIATGKSLKFDRALIIPSKNLKEGEICDTRFEEGEDLINFRSPFLNSNGMCVNTNKYVSEAYGPDGKPLQGVIIVSDETLARIAERQREAGEGIDLPAETESQRQGRDFDGDTIGIAKASDYPNLAAEAIERNRPENAYAPTVKEKKMSFSNPDGSAWEFEKIALFMSDGFSVGKINNVVTSGVALESEAELIRENGAYEEKLEYCQTQQEYYQKLQKRDKNPKSKFTIPDLYRGRIEQFVVESTRSGSNPPEKTLDKLIDLNRSIYKELIHEAAYENQVAVDMFKSARQPNVDKILQSKEILYRKIPYIKDKKREDIYTSRNNQANLIPVDGCSPVEMLVAQTNQVFEAGSLEARPTLQFRDLYEATYTPQQLAETQKQKASFDRAFNNATALSNRLKTEQGPNLKLKVKGIETEIEISNGFAQEDTHSVFDEPTEISLDTIRLVPNPKKSARSPHNLVAIAHDPKTGGDKVLGTVVESDPAGIREAARATHNLEAGQELQVERGHLTPAISKRETDLLFSQAFEALEIWSESIPTEEKAQYAAAAWHVGTGREATDEKRAEKETASYKVSNFSFCAFKDELVDRVANAQIDRFTLVGLQPEAIANLEGTPTEVRFASAPEPGKTQIQTTDGTLLAYLSESSAQLPLGSTGTGTIALDTPATAMLAYPQLSSPIKINKIKQGDFANGKLPENAEIALRLEQSRYPALVLNGKNLGRLDNNSLEILRESGKLDGRPFNVTINTSGKKAIIDLEDGTQVSTSQGFSNYKNNNFVGRQAEVSFTMIPEAKTIYVAYVGDKKLGEINDPAARAILEKAQLNRDGQTLSGAQLSANSTIAALTLQTDSITYPKEGKWSKRNANRELTAERTTPKIVRELQRELSKQPSLAYESKSAIFLIVDRKNAERTVQYFRSKGCEVATPDPRNFAAEIERGYQPIILEKNQLTEELQKLIVKQAGTIYPNNTPEGGYQKELLAKPLKTHLRAYPPTLPQQTLEPLEPQIETAPPLAQPETLDSNPSIQQPPIATPAPDAQTPNTRVHTDGSCLGNPGPGGWAAIVERQNPETGETERLELTGSEANTTNNRMELLATIKALEAIEEPSTVTLHSDSQYVVNTINEGWKRGKNQDLWAQLDEQLAKHDVRFEWVKAHDGNELNERCDTLAKEAAAGVAAESAPIPEPALSPAVTLNADQQAALDKLMTFTQSPGDRTQPETQRFLLTGEAGTGKTFLIAQYCRQLAAEQPNLKIVFTAPTHQAVGVLRKFTEAQNLNAETSTTHRLLGLKQHTDPVSGEISYVPDKMNPPTVANIVVVDETSMIDKNLAKQLEKLPELGTKVIFMGDPKQLPPVGETESPIFQSQFSDRAHLTEVVRYGGEIGKRAREIGANIEAKDYTWLASSEDGQIKNIAGKDWLQATLAEFDSPAFEEDKHHIRILTYTNARKSELNVVVREHLFGENLPEYQTGDFIRANETFFGHTTTFENSEEAIVRHAEKTTDPETGLKIWNLTVERDNGKETRIPVVASESQEDYKKQLKALEETARSSSDGNRKIAWKNFYDFKGEFAQIDYGYACTVHKSQGSTYTKVAIDEGSIVSHYSRHPGKATERNQLMYVALTRAKEEVLTTNPMALERNPERQTQHNQIDSEPAPPATSQPAPDYEEYGGVSFDFDVNDLTPPDDDYSVSPPPTQPQNVTAQSPPEPAPSVQPPSTPSLNPLEGVQPLSEAVARHAIKDKAMAEVATQFIGRSAAPSETSSSTRQYEAAWGDRANTGNYTSTDVVMVSGSGPWRGVSNEQIQATFEEHYKPLLDRAIEAGATIVVGNAKGTDQLVQSYLQERNYQVSDSGQNFKTCSPQPALEIPQPSTPDKQQPQPRSETPPSPIPKAQPAPPAPTQPQPKAEQLDDLPPVSAAYDGFAIAQQLDRTQAIAPVVAALLKTVGRSEYTGENYGASWNSETKELKLFDTHRQQLKMLATMEKGSWVAQPLPGTEVALALNEGDLKAFNSIDRQIKLKLAAEARTTPVKTAQQER